MRHALPAFSGGSQCSLMLCRDAAQLCGQADCWEMLRCLLMLCRAAAAYHGVRNRGLHSRSVQVSFGHGGFQLSLSASSSTRRSLHSFVARLTRLIWQRHSGSCRTHFVGFRCAVRSASPSCFSSLASAPLRSALVDRLVTRIGCGNEELPMGHVRVYRLAQRLRNSLFGSALWFGPISN